MKGSSAPRAPVFGRSDLLRWIYLGRVAIVSGLLVGALLRWFGAEPEQTFLATVAFVVAAVASAASFWYTDILEREAGEAFCYGQVVLDVLLVTAIIHVTGGAESDFAPLYVLVIGEGALLLPLPGGMLIGGLASLLYVADIFWFHDSALRPTVAYQVGLFAVVAFVTGFLGDRLRRTGIAVGAVESELRQLRADTGEILTNLATGVLTVDGEGRLAFLNPAAEALLGVDARQWVGAPVLDRVEEVAPALAEVLRRALREGRVVSRGRAVVRREDGPLVLGVSTAVLERADGGPPSATAIFQDITDFERIAALDRRADRLGAVAELAASLAHEIRNPLASIRSAVEQLSRGTARPEDRLVLERLVLSESDRLSRLLSEFLDFSAIQIGRSDHVELAGLVGDCVAMLRRHPEAEGVEVRWAPEPGEVAVEGDRDLLHRAVFNLLLNALQFSGPGGRVEVELHGDPAPVHAEAQDVERPVRLTVQDTGPGVPETDRGRIFEPFFTTRKGGTGLGLPVVHRAVTSHGGTVFVEDGRDGGARFVLYLPGAPGPARAPAPSPSPATA